MPQMIVLGVLIVVSIAMILYAVLPDRKQKERELLRRMSGKKSQDEQQADARTRAKQSAAARLVERVAPFATRPVMPKSDEDMSNLRVKMATAGFRGEKAPILFLASKTILAVGLGLVTLLTTLTMGQETKNIFGLTAMMAGIGFFLPEIWLYMAKKQRSEKIRNGLPDSLDLMVISVEAGLGLDAAIQRVGEEMRNVHTELSEEMTIATLETQMGVPRAEALGNMASRSGVSEVKGLVAVITQAEKFGTSVAKALRNQADSLRVKRRLKAEERAQKTTVKLMMPLVLFIFPAIFVVLLGPAVIQIMRQFMQGGL